MPREKDDACTDTSFRWSPQKQGPSSLRERFLDSRLRGNERRMELSDGSAANASICPEMIVSGRALQPLRKR